MNRLLDGIRTPSRAVNLAIVIDSLTNRAGTENQVLLLLSAFDRSRVLPTVYTLRGTIAPEGGSFPFVDLNVARLKSLRGVVTPLRLAKSLRSQQADLVMTFFIDANVFGTLAGQLARVPVISSRRNLGHGYWHSPKELRRLRWLNSMTHYFIANSEAIRKYTAEAEGVVFDRIKVIRNAIDTDRFRPASDTERRTARAYFGIPQTDRVIAFVANLRHVKDHATLLRAFAIGLQADGQLRLLLAGQGEEEPLLRTLAAELQISERVQFLGSLEDTLPVFHASDVAVLSSLAESLPNAIIEALACGLPVVATSVGGIPELLAGQPFGHLSPPSDPVALGAALSEVMAGPARSVGARAAARAFAEKTFSLPVILEEWYAFLERCRDETRQRRTRPR